MLTLSFDTNFNKTYIVLKNDEKIITSENLESKDGNYHSAFFMPTLQKILKENNILIKDIDAIGVNIGPGSFTGIRAGITIARVLCQQTNTKLIGINSLKILSKINTSNTKTIVILDARKNRVYYAEFENNNTIIEPTLIEKDELINKIDKNAFIITDKSIGEFLSEQEIKTIQYEENDDNIGLYLSEIITEELKNSSDDFHWAKIKPLYIQQPSITKPKEIK